MRRRFSSAPQKTMVLFYENIPRGIFEDGGDAGGGPLPKTPPYAKLREHKVGSVMICDRKLFVKHFASKPNEVFNFKIE